MPRNVVRTISPTANDWTIWSRVVWQAWANPIRIDAWLYDEEIIPKRR